MNENERIKNEILKRLHETPRYPAYCELCGKYLGSFSRPMNLVHYTCDLERRTLPRIPLKPAD